MSSVQRPYGLERRAFLSALALGSLASAVGAAPGARASTAATAPGAFLAADPAQLGAWSAPFQIGGVAIHAILLHTDDVLFFQYVEGDATEDHTSYVGTWNWTTGVAREAGFSYHRDVFCAGHNILADGRVFIAGGHDHMTGKKQSPVGAAETDVYDPVTRTWTPAPPLGQKRWYPTNVGLANGKSLVFGGHDRPGFASQTVDEYDPVSNTMRTLSPTAIKTTGLYPRMFLVPNGKILKCGPARKSAYFNPATESWSTLSGMLYGGRTRGCATLLPGCTKVLTVGGQSSGSAPPTATAEILDTSQATPKWRYTGSLNHARLLANTVTLPDGQVLVIGGGEKFKFTGPVRIPELWNPATEAWTDMAPQQGSRMYHSTALLLPDGRVFSAGQDNGPLATYGEIFSPPYLFRGPRPTISDAPATAGHGGTLTITSPEAGDITRVVLIHPGAGTHEIDTDQRSVPLTHTASGDTVTATVPTNQHLLPAGHYMLFLVNSNGVPSVARWIRVA